MSNNDQNQHPFRELIEAFALGSLDPEERAAVAAHLATGCAECAKALSEAQWLVSQLAYLAPEAAPSDILRGRLLKTVRAEAAASKAAEPQVLKSTIPFWMWGAVAAVTVFAFYNAYEVHREGPIVDDTARELARTTDELHKLEQQLALAHREALILTDPRSRKIAMPSGKKDMPPLQATWHAALGIVVFGQSLPMPVGNRTLQLWLIPKAPGAQPMPSLTLRPDADGKFDLLVASPPDSQADTKALAITEEPEGGSPQPTTTPLWVGSVTED